MTSNTASLLLIDSTEEQNITVPFLSIVAVTRSDKVVMPFCIDLLMKNPLLSNADTWVCVAPG